MGGAPADQSRNVLAESARIARGQIKDISELTTDAADAVVFPGGFGAAKNLSSFASKGGEMTVIPEVERLITGYHGAGKPLAFCCIAPVLAAKVLGDKNPTLTLGSTGSTDQCLIKELLSLLKVSELTWSRRQFQKCAKMRRTR